MRNLPEIFLTSFENVAQHITSSLLPWQHTLLETSCIVKQFTCQNFWMIAYPTKTRGILYGENCIILTSTDTLTDPPVLQIDW